MATIPQLEQALIAADRAGDVESARLLATELKRLRGGGLGPQRGLGAAFKRGLESQFSAGRTGVGVFAGTPEEAAQAAKEGLTRQEEIGRKYEDQIGLDRLKKAYEEKGILAAGKELARQVPLAIAEQAPQIVATLGSARLGAMAGAPFGPVGVIGGGLTGAAIPSFLMASGSQAERRAQEQTKRGEAVSIDRGELAGTAVPSAALDVASNLVPLGGRLVSKLTGIPVNAFFGRSAAQAEKLANERLLATLAKGTATGAAVEIPTEIAQQMLERAQAGLPLTGPEAFAEYAETAYRVGLLGPIGAVGRLAEKGAAQQEVADRKAAEAAKAQETAVPEATLVAPEAAPPTLTFTGPEQLALPAPERGIPLGYTPTKALLAPTEAPVTQQPSNVVDMMDAYEVANSQLEPLETAMQNAAKAGDIDAINALLPQYKELRTQLDEMQAAIEELGGTTKSPETFEKDTIATLAGLDKKITTAQKKLDNAAELGDFDALPKLGENLNKLKAEREAQAAQFDKERRALTMKGTPKGESVPLFSAAELAQPKSEPVIRPKDAGAGPLPPEDFRRRGKKQLELELEPPKPLARLTAPWRSAKEQREAKEATPEGETYPLFRDIPQRKQPEAAAPVEEAPKAEPTGITLDLFSDFNLFNTAINNRDEKTIQEMQRAREKADRKVKLSPREQVVAALDQQVGGIVRRERNYDVRVITKGPNEGKEVYVYDTVMAELERLTDLVNKPVGNAKRSRLQILHDKWDILQEREAKLEEAKASGDKKEIKKFEGQVAVALRNYEKTLNQVVPIRDAYEKTWRSLFTQTGELAPAPGTTNEPTVLTPRQKQEALLREGRSKREMSKEAKAAKRVNKGKVKVSKAKVAQELGRDTDEYEAFIAPYEKQLATAVKAYEKFVDDANKELAKRKAKEVDKKEVAKVEKQLAAAIAARDAVPFENPIERKKADKLVNSLEQHLKVVKTPKSDAYKAAEANIVKLHEQKVAELNRLKDELTEIADAKAEELGIQQPEFEEALAEATEAYQEAVAGGEQQIKSLRTTQATRKLPKMKTTRTASEESRAETASRQAEFESGLSEEKGAAYDYRQREEARERTQRARQAKEAKGTAMQVAMTKAAQEKIISEVKAKEQEEGKFARGVEIESPDLTDAQVKLLEANDIRGALRSIMNAPDTTPIYKAVIEAMLPMLDATNVKLYDKLYDPEGREVLGEAVSKLVKLSRSGGLSQEVLLHEATHAAVERVIQMGEKDITLLTKEQQAAFKELRAIHAQIKKDPSITSTNAKSSLSEFAAELFSNRNLHEQLRKKPWRISNMLDAIRSVILRLLGVKQPQSMLGAGLKAVEALMMPTSLKPVIKEKPVNRNYSQKDIAALHTGSNSMRQFAEQFGPEIKQKDRTTEDVDRLANKYLTEMIATPGKFITAPDATKLNLASMTRMDDGRTYDPNNPVDYYTANPDVVMLGATDKSGLINFAQLMTDRRYEALAELAEYLQSNPDYTLAEQALVAKAASKYGVITDKNGKLKVVMLDATNLHPVAVVGRVSSNAIIEELRAGKSLKEAFSDGMQRVADENAKQNVGKQGWKRFAQSSDYDAAVALNAGAAGTSWCTGTHIGNAQSHIENGDFYIYYNKGKPEVAVRMTGTDTIAEIRGNTPNQALTAEQQKTAIEFINKKDFAGANDYITSIELREKMASVLKGESKFTPEEAQKFFTVPLRIERAFEIMRGVYNADVSPMRLLIAELPIMGYGQGSTMSPAVAEASDRVLSDAIVAAARGNRFITATFVVSPKSADSFVTSFESPFTKGSLSFRCKTKDIKALLSIKDRSFEEDATINLKNLEKVRSISLSGKRTTLLLDNVKSVGIVSLDNSAEDGPSILAVPDTAHISKIRPESKQTSLLLSGNPTIKTVVLTNGPYTLELVAPDVTKILAVEERMLGDSVAGELIKAVIKAHPSYPNRQEMFAFDITVDKVGDAFEIRPVENRHLVILKLKEKKDLAAHTQKVTNTLFSALSKQAQEKLVRDMNTYYQGRVGLDTFVEQTAIEHLRGVAREDVDAKLDELQKAAEKLGIGKEYFDDYIRPLRGTLTAPESVKDKEEVFDAEFVEILEEPRYAPKDVGAYEKAKGVFGFRSQTQATPVASSFVAQERGAVDNFRANALGLAGRVQFVDQYAALSEALRKGVDSKVVQDLEAEQAEYFLRFGQQRSQFATQFLTNGPVQIVSQDTKRGKEFTYTSTPGANMIQVAEALEKAGIDNSTQLEAMFTAYVAGMRAKQVGWDKLNINNPALAKSEYDEVMAMLNANKRASDAFEKAAKIYKQYNAGELNFLVQTGFMSKAKAEELKQIDYIPYYRVKSGELQLMVDKETPIRIANIKDEPELHSLVGDNTQIMPIFTSAVQNTFILTNMGLRNQSVKDTAFLLKRMGIASKLSEGVGPSGPDTVRFKVKGVDHFAVIDSDAYGIPAELIVKGMEGIKTTIPAAVRLMGIPADWLRIFVTRNPAYAVRQAVRDPLTAYMTTGVDGVPVLNSFKELSKMIAGRSEEERKLMASGAISTNVLTGDERDMEMALRDISAGKSGFTKLLAKADALAMQGDAATRAVIYKDSIAKGMSDMQAYLRTLESMNFGRRGLSPSMQMMSTLIPFFNAQIQGLDVLYRAFTGKYGGMPHQKQLEIKKKMLMRGTLMAIATMAYVMTMEDDEAYKRAKPEERLGNWFVYTPFADEPLKIPIPFELGYLFKALPEAVYNMAANDERNKDITKGMGKLIGMSNPFALPAAIKPATEVILGRSFFGGDIESMRERETLMPTERYRANTTELSKLVGSVTGKVLTPIELDYLIRGHTGGLGMAIVSLANPILNTELGADVPEPTTKASKLPFIGGLFQPVEGRGTLDAAYERMKEVQQATGTFKRLVESGKRAEAMEFLEEYRNKIAAISVSGAVQQRLGELAKYRRLIIETPKLTTEQKDVLLDRLDTQQYEIARGFVNLTERTKPQ